MFYKRLENICKRKKKTVAEVLKAAKVPLSTATYWRQGGNPSVKWLTRLADVLHVNPTQFLQ